MHTSININFYYRQNSEKDKKNNHIFKDPETWPIFPIFGTKSVFFKKFRALSKHQMGPLALC